ncbi:chondroitin proteoglycan 2 [Nephila pilipes]|uniref:Chondroitin proteoglycan 2 n=1 Tax=Nephila pilipes TaxID=299642 RepID=A0A8X6UMC3_NEPPI|nr:chondroitin proteoglycan 2 [Nephila pilipes]
MDAKMFNFGLVIFSVVLTAGVQNAGAQSVPDPLFVKGCRAQRGQFPHETYCQQYYNCWDGRATIEECPGKLLFNPVISACDFPEAVNCLARLRNPEPAMTADGRCLKQFGIFPDPVDCTAFYECSYGRAFRQVCPYYTAFDERYSVCVHAYDVECGGRGGIYGTLAPPIFSIPDGGISAQIGVVPQPGASGSASEITLPKRKTLRHQSAVINFSARIVLKRELSFRPQSP